MGQECSGLKGSQSDHNCVTDTKKSAKTGQNWPKIAQTMAIFHHKWLILWDKKLFSSISSCQWVLVNFWSLLDIWKYPYLRPAPQFDEPFETDQLLWMTASVSLTPKKSIYCEQNRQAGWEHSEEKMNTPAECSKRANQGTGPSLKPGTLHRVWCSQPGHSFWTS